MEAVHVEAAATPESVLATVAQLLGEVVGDDFFLDQPITMVTSFAHDLELESIEFVALSERLQEHYGEKVDFVVWISEMELPEIIGLSVGQLVDHITSCLNDA
jgi:acyl carrier protein